MKSASGIDWEIRRFLPRDLRRVCVWSVAFYATVGVAMLMVAWGVALLGRVEGIGPYAVILLATATGVLFGTFIWDAAGGAASVAQNESPDRADPKAPVHQQKWTYQQLRHQWAAPLVVAIIWHAIGLASLTHYLAINWPPTASGFLLFVSYEMIGLIPLNLAIRRIRRNLTT